MGVSFQSKVRPRTLGCITMGSPVLCAMRVCVDVMSSV